MCGRRRNLALTENLLRLITLMCDRPEITGPERTNSKKKLRACPRALEEGVGNRNRNDDGVGMNPWGKGSPGLRGQALVRMGAVGRMVVGLGVALGLTGVTAQAMMPAALGPSQIASALSSENFTYSPAPGVSRVAARKDLRKAPPAWPRLPPLPPMHVRQHHPGVRNRWELPTRRWGLVTCKSSRSLCRTTAQYADIVVRRLATAHGSMYSRSLLALGYAVVRRRSASTGKPFCMAKANGLIVSAASAPRIRYESPEPDRHRLVSSLTSLLRYSRSASLRPMRGSRPILSQ